MIIIWKSLISYLNENLRSGKSVSIRNFGAFTFDIATELPKIAVRSMNPQSDL
jgi:nucleoid DNA-binding protein